MRPRAVHCLRIRLSSNSGGTALLALIFTAAMLLPAPVVAKGFTFDALTSQARQLAQTPYQAQPEVPQRFRQLSFDQWNSIRWSYAKPLWPDSPFHVLLRPAGYLFTRPIAVHLVDGQGVHTLPFEPSRFAYDPKQIGGPLPANLGYAGISVLYPINDPKRFDEVISFLGASYFRAVPREGRFGLSARGLAIDTADPAGEEFPRFSAFWLVKPAPGAKQMTMYALLDSPSVTGAYRFIIRPGQQTTVAVKATLFLRKPIKKLGLAPLTSMYLYGVGDHRPAQSPFPAIHDSDGLLLHGTDNQWVWRPLTNPRKVMVSTFHLPRFKGFGLMQRDRKFNDYQSLNMYYQDRPSAWITPAGKWGAGHVELVENPSAGETNDNIVAFWVPKHLPTPGQPFSFAYTIGWQLDQPRRSPLGHVMATRVGGSVKNGTTKFVIDYSSPQLAALGKKSAIKGRVEVNPVTRIVENRVLKNPYVNGWRQVIQVLPLPDQPVTVRASLVKNGKPLTESWQFLMPAMQ